MENPTSSMNARLRGNHSSPISGGVQYHAAANTARIGRPMLSSTARRTVSRDRLRLTNLTGERPVVLTVHGKEYTVETELEAAL